jgi:hypothetical protein
LDGIYFYYQVFIESALQFLALPSYLSIRGLEVRGQNGMKPETFFDGSGGDKP